jgi:hypothetical protein
MLKILSPEYQLYAPQGYFLLAGIVGNLAVVCIAFLLALAYTLQCVVAWVVAWQMKDLHRRSLGLPFCFLLEIMRYYCKSSLTPTSRLSI